jgi:hypothetical protein
MKVSTIRSIRFGLVLAITFLSAGAKAATSSDAGASNRNTQTAVILRENRIYNDPVPYCGYVPFANIEVGNFVLITAWWDFDIQEDTVWVVSSDRRIMANGDCVPAGEVFAPIEPHPLCDTAHQHCLQHFQLTMQTKGNKRFYLLPRFIGGQIRYNFDVKVSGANPITTSTQRPEHRACIRVGRASLGTC